MREGDQEPDRTATIYATAVLIADAATPFGGRLNQAVLLLGESGAGKSDVALRLIAMGARLIADDQTVLLAQGSRLFAAAPSSLHGKMEIRGVGIVTMECAPLAQVVLAVQLGTGVNIARLPEPGFFHLPSTLADLPGPPLISLAAFEASTPAKIAAAAWVLARGAIVAGAFSGSPASFLQE